MDLNGLLGRRNIFETFLDLVKPEKDDSDGRSRTLSPSESLPNPPVLIKPESEALLNIPVSQSASSLTVAPVSQANTVSLECNELEVQLTRISPTVINNEEVDASGFTVRSLQIASVSKASKPGRTSVVVKPKVTSGRTRSCRLLSQSGDDPCSILQGSLHSDLLRSPTNSPNTQDEVYPVFEEEVLVHNLDHYNLSFGCFIDLFPHNDPSRAAYIHYKCTRLRYPLPLAVAMSKLYPPSKVPSIPSSRGTKAPSSKPRKPDQGILEIDSSHFSLNNPSSFSSVGAVYASDSGPRTKAQLLQTKKTESKDMFVSNSKEFVETSAHRTQRSFKRCRTESTSGDLQTPTANYDLENQASHYSPFESGPLSTYENANAKWSRAHFLSSLRRTLLQKVIHSTGRNLKRRRSTDCVKKSLVVAVDSDSCSCISSSVTKDPNPADSQTVGENSACSQSPEHKAKNLDNHRFEYFDDGAKLRSVLCYSRQRPLLRSSTYSRNRTSATGFHSPSLLFNLHDSQVDDAIPNGQPNQHSSTKWDTQLLLLSSENLALSVHSQSSLLSSVPLLLTPTTSPFENYLLLGDVARILYLLLSSSVTVEEMQFVVHHCRRTYRRESLTNMSLKVKDRLIPVTSHAIRQLSLLESLSTPILQVFIVPWSLSHSVSALRERAIQLLPPNVSWLDPGSCMELLRICYLVLGDKITRQDILSLRYNRQKQLSQLRSSALTSFDLPPNLTIPENVHQVLTSLRLFPRQHITGVGILTRSIENLLSWFSSPSGRHSPAYSNIVTSESGPADFLGHLAFVHKKASDCLSRLRDSYASLISAGSCLTARCRLALNRDSSDTDQIRIDRGRARLFESTDAARLNVIRIYNEEILPSLSLLIDQFQRMEVRIRFIMGDTNFLGPFHPHGCHGESSEAPRQVMINAMRQVHHAAVNAGDVRTKHVLDTIGEAFSYMKTNLTPNLLSFEKQAAVLKSKLILTRDSIALSWLKTFTVSSPQFGFRADSDLKYFSSKIQSQYDYVEAWLRYHHNGLMRKLNIDLLRVYRALLGTSDGLDVPIQFADLLIPYGSKNCASFQEFGDAATCDFLPNWPPVLKNVFLIHPNKTRLVLTNLPVQPPMSCTNHVKPVQSLAMTAYSPKPSGLSGSTVCFAQKSSVIRCGEFTKSCSKFLKVQVPPPTLKQSALTENYSRSAHSSSASLSPRSLRSMRSNISNCNICDEGNSRSVNDVQKKLYITSQPIPTADSLPSVPASGGTRAKSLISHRRMDSNNNSKRGVVICDDDDNSSFVNDVLTKSCATVQPASTTDSFVLVPSPGGTTAVTPVCGQTKFPYILSADSPTFDQPLSSICPDRLGFENAVDSDGPLRSPVVKVMSDSDLTSTKDFPVIQDPLLSVEMPSETSGVKHVCVSLSRRSPDETVTITSHFSSKPAVDEQSDQIQNDVTSLDRRRLGRLKRRIKISLLSAGGSLNSIQSIEKFVEHQNVTMEAGPNILSSACSRIVSDQSSAGEADSHDVHPLEFDRSCRSILVNYEPFSPVVRESEFLSLPLKTGKLRPSSSCPDLSSHGRCACFSVSSRAPVVSNCQEHCCEFSPIAISGDERVHDSVALSSDSSHFMTLVNRSGVLANSGVQGTDNFRHDVFSAEKDRGNSSYPCSPPGPDGGFVVCRGHIVSATDNSAPDQVDSRILEHPVGSDTQCKQYASALSQTTGDTGNSLPVIAGQQSDGEMKSFNNQSLRSEEAKTASVESQCSSTLELTDPVDGPSKTNSSICTPPSLGVHSSRSCICEVHETHPKIAHSLCCFMAGDNHEHSSELANSEEKMFPSRCLSSTKRSPANGLDGDKLSSVVTGPYRLSPVSHKGSPCQGSECFDFGRKQTLEWHHTENALLGKPNEQLAEPSSSPNSSGSVAVRQGWAKIGSQPGAGIDEIVTLNEKQLLKSQSTSRHPTRPDATLPVSQNSACFNSIFKFCSLSSIDGPRSSITDLRNDPDSLIIRVTDSPQTMGAAAEPSLTSIPILSDKTLDLERMAAELNQTAQWIEDKALKYRAPGPVTAAILGEIIEPTSPNSVPISLTSDE